MYRFVSGLRFIEPQLASPVEQPPEGKHWIHEVKHDGYRCQVLVEQGRTRVFTRNGHDWTDRFPSLVSAARGLRCESGIIDGEAVVQDGNGVSDFVALRSAIHSKSPGIIMFAFDLLHIDGKDLRQRPLTDRRAFLKHLIGDFADNRIQYSEEFTGDAVALFKACRNLGLEGIVSKHAMAPYRSGRTKTWLKTKCFAESAFVVVGTDRDRKTGALRALLAHPDSDGLKYAGAAFIALAGDERAQFFTEVDRLTTSWALFKSTRLTDVRWCHPKLTVVVRHLAASKKLRHATVRSLAR
jgi:bifunctional non-homologous end joining protein LigD